MSGGPLDNNRRFEILARQVFERFKALITEPPVFACAERHDNIEAIYKSWWSAAIPRTSPSF